MRGALSSCPLFAGHLLTGICRTGNPSPQEDKTGIQKALKSALLLDRKAEEYKKRLSSLQVGPLLHSII